MDWREARWVVLSRAWRVKEGVERVWDWETARRRDWDIFVGGWNGDGGGGGGVDDDVGEVLRGGS